MRISWKITLCALLAPGCASTRPSSLLDCPRESSLARGIKEGASGRKANLAFTHSCTPETRAIALAAYREGYAQARPKKKDIAPEPAEEIDDDTADTALEVPALPTPAPVPVANAVREPSAVSWVCEVEANSRVFTGVGVTRDEALVSARATCGSHFQSSICTKADCKQNM